jgi:hypothetical protein
MKGSKKITDTKVPIAVIAGDDNNIVALKSENIKDKMDTKKIPLDANKKETAPRSKTLFLEKELFGSKSVKEKLTFSSLDILSCSLKKNLKILSSLLMYLAKINSEIEIKKYEITGTNIITFKSEDLSIKIPIKGKPIKIPNRETVAN